ncbi:MAG: hypothetical protein ACI8UD_004075 [Planctomycetota bacterium]|jgi:hypothetical protein
MQSILPEPNWRPSVWRNRQKASCIGRPLTCSCPLPGRRRLPQKERISVVEFAVRVVWASHATHRSPDLVDTADPVDPCDPSRSLFDRLRLHTVGAVQHPVVRGDLDSEHFVPERSQRHPFFTNTLRAIGAQADAAEHAPLILKSHSPDGESYLITVAFFRAANQQPQIDKILEFHALPDGDGYRFQSPFDHYDCLPMHAVNGVTFHAREPLDLQRAEQFFTRLHRILGVDEAGFHELIVRLIRV